MDEVNQTLQGLAETLRFPLDNPDQTLVVTLVVVVAGLLLTAVLIALAASDGHANEEDAESRVDNSNHEYHLGD